MYTSFSFLDIIYIQYLLMSDPHVPHSMFNLVEKIESSDSGKKEGMLKIYARFKVVILLS